MSSEPAFTNTPSKQKCWPGTWKFSFQNRLWNIIKNKIKISSKRFTLSGPETYLVAIVILIHTISIKKLSRGACSWFHQIDAKRSSQGNTQRISGTKLWAALQQKGPSWDIPVSHFINTGEAYLMNCWEQKTATTRIYFLFTRV